MKLTILIIISLMSLPSCIKKAEEISVGLATEWKFTTEDNPAFSSPAYDDSQWKTIKADNNWEAFGYNPYDGYAWYRIKVMIPSGLRSSAYLKDSLRIFLGKINDFDQTYLNGQYLGSNLKTAAPGDKPDSDFVKAPVIYWNKERNYIIPANDPRINWDQENVIAVRVFDEGGKGGIYSGNQEIRMTRITDYLKFDKRSSQYVFENGYLKKSFSVKNISSFYSVSGTLSINAVDIITGEKLFTLKKKTNLAPGDLWKYTVSLLQPANSTMVTTMFTSDKSGGSINSYDECPYITTPASSPEPRINGTRLFGVRPGSPFLFTIPVTGERPVKYEARNLPAGLVCDQNTGQITGVIEKPGEYLTVFKATNAKGSAEREFRIVCGDRLALTPHMGWNSWYIWENNVTDRIMREAADAMVSTGMMDHGYSYVNIDDCWSVKPSSKDSTLLGEPRDKNGMINSNKRFPDMKALTDYIHSKGLKAGIYTSPGPYTCGGYIGAYRFEEKDIARYVDWGFDFLKYDWCSYGTIGRENYLPDLKKPYLLMSEILRKQKRDIILNICQYGMGEVWKWGKEVGGNSWRTAGDLGMSFEDIGRAIFRDGFDEYSRDSLHLYGGPGGWNDPDYLLVGYLSNFNGKIEWTSLTPDEQYTCLSLWSLVAAPFILSGDITRLDEFTLQLLTNDEIIEVDQDPLGKPGFRVSKSGEKEVWMRHLEDGSVSVGLFNRGETVDMVSTFWKDLGLTGEQKVRDLWRQKDLGIFNEKFTAKVGRHGVVMLRLWPAAK